MVKLVSRSGRTRGSAGGFNQRKVRAYNERLVLSLIKRHGALAKSEITKRSGLSAQAVSVIIRELEKDGLLLKGDPVRGRVGQPSVPMALNPEGAYSLGLKVGRRSADLVLIDFVGSIVRSIQITYSYPMPDMVLAFAVQGIRDLVQAIEEDERDKIAGIGIAMPFHLWDWEEKIGAPEGTMHVWKDFDFAEQLEERTGYPTFTQNDGTAACGAEISFGRGIEFSDFLYVFVGTFVGGGIALNNSIYSGRTRNAGALASLPLPEPGAEEAQLIDYASLFFLERILKQRGLDPTLLQQSSFDWTELGDVIEEWLDKAAHYLALAIANATAILDVEVVIIDGTMPPNIREMLIDKVRLAQERKSWRGIEQPVILEGSLGAPARALGAASLPLLVRYLLDQNMLLTHM